MTARARVLDLGGIQLPLDLVTESNAILGKKGSGKSTAGLDLFEEIYNVGVPVVSIDPKGDHWGVRSGADGTPDQGLPVPVFGGLHGDLPLAADSGEYIADLLRSRNLSAVLDVSEFSAAERRKFLTAFTNRLYRRAERAPMHLLIEEAHEVIPQRVDSGDAPMVGAFERLVKLGRFKGIGVTMLSQRSASLNKNVLTQVDNLFMLRTVSPQDRAAVRAWIETHSESSAIIDSLPSLATGECWLWQPERGEPVKFRFRPRRTYDAGTTPKVGESPRPPATLADINLAAIQSEMAATIERARNDDPKALRQRIVALERQLAQQTDSGVAEPRLVEVPVPVITDDDRKALEGMIDRFEHLVADEARGLVRDLQEAMATGEALAERLRAVVRDAPPARSGQTSPARNAPRVAPQRTLSPEIRAKLPRNVVLRPAASTDGDLKLSKMQKAIVTTLAAHGELSTRQIGLFTGYAHKSGSFANSLSGLRTRGLIIGGAQAISVTPEGLTVLDANGGFEPLPSGQALVEWWLAKLPKAQAAMLSALLEVYPEPLSVDELAARTGYAAGSGSFANNRSRLNVAELIHGTRDALYAADTLGIAHRQR
ncbi:ATP-binding protein [Microbacterium gorillae]|uniref:ATP-binding protein n=1 Tax=Microbacterium gorillae TaxID=1231063 RepID=UPI003D973DCD